MIDPRLVMLHEIILENTSVSCTTTRNGKAGTFHIISGSGFIYPAGWNYLSIPKFQRLYRWGFGMDKKFNPTIYNGCDYLSMLRLKLNHVSKKEPQVCGSICTKILPRNWSFVKGIYGPYYIAPITDRYLPRAGHLKCHNYCIRDCHDRFLVIDYLYYMGVDVCLQWYCTYRECMTC